MAGAVDEHLAADGLVLAQHQGNTPLKLPVEILKARWIEAIRLLLPALFQEEHKIDA